MLKTVTPGEALSILYSAFGARRTEAEACPLALARGRVLAEDVEAAEFVPGFDRSSVDGYALAAADTFGCGEASPALLRLAGRVEMGRAPDFALSPGECAEIPTGGRLPEGADAVVMLIEQGAQAAMNHYNKVKKPEKSVDGGDAGQASDKAGQEKGSVR